MIKHRHLFVVIMLLLQWQGLSGQSIWENESIRKIQNNMQLGHLDEVLKESKQLLDTTKNPGLRELSLYYRLKALIRLNIDVMKTIGLYQKAIKTENPNSNALLYDLKFDYYSKFKINYDSAFNYKRLYLTILRKANTDVLLYTDYGDLAYFKLRTNLIDDKGILNVNEGLRIIESNKAIINKKYPYLYSAAVSFYFTRVFHKGINDHWTEFYSQDYKAILNNWYSIIKSEPHCNYSYYSYYSVLSLLENYKSQSSESINKDLFIEYLKKQIFYGTKLELIFRNTVQNQIIKKHEFELKKLMSDSKIHTKREYSLKDMCIFFTRCLNTEDKDSFSMCLNSIYNETPPYLPSNRYIYNHLNRHGDWDSLINYLDLFVSLSFRVNSAFECRRIVGWLDDAMSQVESYLWSDLTQERLISLNRYLGYNNLLELKGKADKISLICRRRFVNSFDRGFAHINGVSTCIAGFLINSIIKIPLKGDTKTYREKVFTNFQDQSNTYLSSLNKLPFYDKDSLLLVDKISNTHLSILNKVLYCIYWDSTQLFRVYNEGAVELDDLGNQIREKFRELYILKSQAIYEQLSGVIFELNTKHIWKPNTIWTLRKIFSNELFFDKELIGVENAGTLRSIFLDLLVNTANMSTVTTKRIANHSKDELKEYSEQILSKNKPIKSTLSAALKKPITNKPVLFEIAELLKEDECCLFPFYDRGKIRLFVYAGGDPFELNGPSNLTIREFRNPALYERDTLIGFWLDFLGGYWRTIHIMPVDEVSTLINYRALYNLRNRKVNDKIDIHQYRDPLSLIKSLRNSRNKSIILKKAVFAGDFEFGVSEEYAFMNDGFHNKRAVTTTTEGKFWSTLDGTSKEIKNSSKYFRKSKILSGAKVTSEKLINSTTGFDNYVFHIATHGYYIEGDDHPFLRSGLVLSNANVDPSAYISGANVINWDLNGCNLFVLSACQSAVGDYISSYSNSGIIDAISIAGPKYILGSLWDIPDLETNEFFGYFYKSLSKSKNINYAFDKAQKSMQAKYPPYYWAAFCLYRN